MARRAAQATTTGANDGMTVSAAGTAALSRREGVGGAPGNAGGAYTDSADNCTVGVGIKVHQGPCTAVELAQRADDKANATKFNDGIRDAEGRIKRLVLNRQLNQNQFDALVSVAFNSGAGVNPALREADNNNDVGVVVVLRGLVLIHHRDAKGNIVGKAEVSVGLVHRRAGEIAQYGAPVVPAAGRGR